MKKIILAVFSILALVIIAGVAINFSTIALAMDGYTKTCSYIADGEYCHYCKCETGKGLQGIPNWQCDDGSKPVCVNSLDELKSKINNTEKSNSEKNQKGEK